ncbi:hypothetical protein CEP52_016476 [Fusarium oligoseptatum]|uniref:JmjC domain-containing protein n=1 Tax=Fusarium oligoseptatum TaxID=2604345 RepID=A0A428S370_9HYPO|nr:hypothetical protein CEP52_016476 [Fusarium oligoseptatum]
MHNESCRYRSTIANLSPSPVTDEEKRWHQFYMRAVVTQQRHPPVNQHNYNTRPVPDYAFDKQWATKVLDQTKAWLNNNPLNDSEDNETHRHGPARQIVNFLTHGHSPSSEEAVYCSTDEAMELVAAGDKILITKDQQQINWGGRPIEALFGTWYTPSDLASETKVNIPQRPISSYIKVKKTIRDVSRRFLENHPSTESWNILDLRNPIPPRSPSFLDTPNSQLFHSLLEEIHNDRRPATHNLLLSEGGNHTAAHVDSHGFGTFITVHEGQFGFGWVAVKNVEDRELWEKDPLSLDVAKMARYVILHPGQTGYFPSGTIHFVFRLVDEPTLAVSGDALAWSCILQWLRVLRRQELDKSAANSDVTQTSVKKWTSSLRKLVTQRINLSKTDDTQDHLQLIGGEEMAQHIIEIIKASIESYVQKPPPASNLSK